MTASVEIVDAVQQLLESEGVLQSIRAQLRASVINALATKTVEVRTSKAVEFVRKESGRDSILCLLDLLSKLGLLQTLSVFEAEIGMTYAEFSSESDMDNLTEKLRIMSSLRDVHEPILYQLIEGTVSASLEKDRQSRMMSMDSPKPTSTIHISSLQPAQSASSSSSIVKQEKAIPSIIGKSTYEFDYKQEGKAQEVEKLTPHSAIPVDEMDYDDNDDSFADSKEVEAFKPEDKISKDFKDEKKEKKDEKKAELHEEKAVYEKAVYEPTPLSDDEKSYDDAPEVDDIEDDIEIEGGSESSASFSLEYGYVEDLPMSNDAKKISPSLPSLDKDEKKDNKNDNKKDDKKDTDKVVDKVLPAVTVVAAKSTVLSVEGLKEVSKDKGDKVPSRDAVGVQKLAQGSVTRSKVGWNTSEREHEDDFMFSEEPESDSGRPMSQNSRAVGLSGASSVFRAANTYDDMEETVLENVEASRPSLAPAARSSWGSNAVKNDKNKGNKGGRGDRYDSDDSDQSDSDAMSVAEDDESMGSDEDEDEEEPTRRKSNNQEEDDEMDSKKKETGGSLFMSRSQSGALPQIKPTAAAGRDRSKASTSGFRYGEDEDEDEEDDVSADFETDENDGNDDNDFNDGKDDSSKLSEVERRLAAMEKEDHDLVALRLQDDKGRNLKDVKVGMGGKDDNGGKEDKEDKVDKKNDLSEMSNNGDGDYSEGDFESGSDEEDEEIEAADESIASEDIEAMELSVGGAGSDSDGSFSGLNSVSSNKKDDKKEAPLWGSTTTLKNQRVSQVSAYKPAPKRRSADDSDFSQSVSDSVDLDFSVTEVEMSSSRGIESDGYDFTTTAVPVQSKGPRDRTAGW